MKLDHETQKYLMMRNFYRLLKSPALILYALKKYENLPSEYLSDDNTGNTLTKIKEEFESKILIDLDDAQQKVLTSLRPPGFNLKIQEKTEIPHWKKHFFDVLAIVLKQQFYEKYSNALDNQYSQDLVQKFQKIKEYDLEFTAQYFPILQKEVLNIHPKTSFNADNFTESDYEKEEKAFTSSFFKLSFLEQIYIQILKFIHCVASFFDSPGPNQSKAPR